MVDTRHHVSCWSWSNEADLGPCRLQGAVNKIGVCCLCREAATDWGLQCMRYEIRDISPPPGVKAAMELQAEAERRKRAQVHLLMSSEICIPGSNSPDSCKSRVAASTFGYR